MRQGREMAALAHPVRVRILAHLRRHDAVTPRELADALRLPHSTVSYHLRRLHTLGTIVRVERRQRGGAVRHRYALAEAPSEARTRALLDALAIGELRADLRHLFTRIRELEAETVQRTGVSSDARAFAVDVSCVLDAER